MQITSKQLLQLLTWVAAALAAVCQVVIVAAFSREMEDLTKYGKGIPISEIEVRLHGGTAATLGWIVIVSLMVLGALCVYRRCFAPIVFSLGWILLFGAFLQLYFTYAEEQIWKTGVLYMLVCLVIAVLRDQRAAVRGKREAPEATRAFSA